MSSAARATSASIRVDADLALVPLDAGTAAAVVDGDRVGRSWAPDFPTHDDVVVAAMVAAWPQPAATRGDPYGSPWHVLEHGVVVGTLGFKGGPRDGAVEVGYDLAPSARGRGLMTRALGALLDLAPPGVDITAETAAGNVASRAVLQRLGFEPDADRPPSADGLAVFWRRSSGPRR